MDSDLFDKEMMTRAIQVGEQGRLSAAPNPWVGCVLVKEGKIISEGYHRAAGEPHAEANALRHIGSNAQGSTAYVTLEPCSHHGRTPPCADALIAAKISRVVVAVVDPDPRVQGRGIALLEAAGISVTSGVCQQEAEQSLLPYLHHRRTGRPYCLIKTASSIDGRTAAADGTSRWITGPEARADVHRLRAESQAVIVGAGTALADLPSLTCRDCSPLPPRQPLRVLLDGKGIVSAEGPLFDTTLAPTLVITTTQTTGERCRQWEMKGAEVAVVSADPQSNGVNLAEVMDLLGKRGILQALVEGGSHLHQSMIREGLMDRLVVYIGPRILGAKGLPVFADESIETITAAPVMRLIDVRRFGDSIRLDYSRE